ncbi:DUF1045 domain-containing protein [Pseudothauera nasutitermitis]|uniref:DUF1045 domain-containing protein n=1 Tax=Pseudothauera nasutitermitis TaxID=2565930 RepID=UPI001454BD81|nr:DUF1045 domain-containing protein [Pseudothauera nasutitermitis]
MSAPVRPSEGGAHPPRGAHAARWAEDAPASAAAASAVRHAVYFAPPPHSALWRAGSAWLGRDAAAGGAGELPPLALEGFDATAVRAFTAKPRRYGFHATLKAPFHLRAGCDEDSLRAALAGLAGQLAPFALRLRVGRVGDFLALVPAGPAAELDALAATCVTGLDAWRRAPDAAELARRAAAGLDARERALLARWGYPWVLERFRFHMTLTDTLADGVLERLLPELDAYFAPLLAGPVAVDALSLFRQPCAGAPFELVERFALRAPAGV